MLPCGGSNAPPPTSMVPMGLLLLPVASGTSLEVSFCPIVSLPALRRVKVAVALLIQQANTPKSLSCVRLSCRTLLRSCSEAFGANLWGDGAIVGWAVR